MVIGWKGQNQDLGYEVAILYECGFIADEVILGVPTIVFVLKLNENRTTQLRERWMAVSQSGSTCITLSDAYSNIHVEKNSETELLTLYFPIGALLAVVPHYLLGIDMGFNVERYKEANYCVINSHS